MAQRTAVLCAMALLLAALPTTFRYARSAALLLRVTDPAAPPLPLLSHPITTQPITLEVHGAALRAHLYVPLDALNAPGIVLLHGVHPRGIDEPRLVAFARSLAQTGLSVLTPELPELIAYRVEAGTVDHIADFARQLSERLRVQSVGVVGISFAGGLALIAAAHAPAAQSIAFVLTLGAHHDLERLCRYYAGMPVHGPRGETPNARPHPYGARVLLRQHLERLFDAEDLDAARSALDTYLQDQHSTARRQALALSARGQRTMAILLDHSQTTQLGELLAHACSLVHDELAAASPSGKLTHLTIPVFLIHGEGDPIIPSIETRWLAQEVPHAALRAAIITPLLRHAEFPSPPTASNAWELISVMAEMLREAGATRFMPARTTL